MGLRGVVGAVVVSLAAASAPAWAGAHAPQVEWRSATTVHGDLSRATGSPQQWATRAAERFLGARDLRVERVRTSLIGTHVRGRQYRAGLPVDGTDWLATAIRGRVVQVDAHPTDLPGGPAARPVGTAAATASAVRRTGASQLLVAPTTSRLLVPRDDRLVDTYRVTLVSRVPARAATVDVAAADGRVLGVRDQALPVEGSATLFDPSPVVTKRDLALRQPYETGYAADADLDSAELTAQLRRLPLTGLSASALGATRLQGPHVNVLGYGYVPTDGTTFDVTRGDPRFEGLMAYAHLDRLQRHLQSLGFRGARAVNASAQDILPGGVKGFDNAFYYPFADLIVMGDGGVDDGEDGEILVHEYGHAIQHDQVTNFGQSVEGGAMGEGFGDVLAAAYYARVSGGFGDACFAEWDYTTSARGGKTCLRRLDGTKRYPQDLSGEPHDDGEIWSSLLWQVRSGMSGSAATRSDALLRLVITSHELLTPEAQFADGVAALRTTASAMGRPDWVRLIDRAAGQRGVPLSP